MNARLLDYQPSRFFPAIMIYYLAESGWRVALLWIVLSATRSPVATAIAVAADLVPTIWVGLVGPHRGAGHNIRLLVLWQAVVIAVALSVFRQPFAIPGLITVAAANGWLSARVVPSAQAALMQSVPVRHKAQASARYEIASRTGMLLGPALTGWALSRLATPWTLLGAVALFALAAGLFGMLPIAGQGFVNGPSAPAWRDVWQIIRHDAFLRIALEVRGLNNFLWPAFTLGVPLMTLSVWHGGAVGYGGIRSLWAASTIFSTVLLARVAGPRIRRLYFWSWVFTGIGFVAMAASPSYPVAAAAAVLGAVGSPIVHVALDSYIGTAVAPPLQGRVFAFQQLVMASLGALGMGGVALALRHLSVEGTLLAAGLLMALAALWGAWRAYGTSPETLADAP
ncbi:MAG: hypothetical protein M0Z53_02330 [Thermaerobacter sp.]|nr:hypothetical protein [Thermaerobacter sp.]